MKKIRSKIAARLWSLAWKVAAPYIKPTCSICKTPAVSVSGYNRIFRQCPSCGFICCHDYPESSALEGMGMTGSWGGASKGGEREDYLTRMLAREFSSKSFLLYGVGSALAFPVLRSQGFDVHGTDVGADVIAFRQREFGARQFFHANEVDERPHTYDAVVACEVFEHFHDPMPWIAKIVTCMRPDAVLCGTTNFHPGGPIEDGQKVGYMSLKGHVAYWSEKAMARALRPFGMKVVSFEMICPGSIKPDKKYNDLFPNKRVFFGTADNSKYNRLLALKASFPILPIDLSDYEQPEYK